MTVTIYPSKTGGLIEAIASKSQAHRLLVCAALYGGRTKINCRTVSEDIQATAACLRALGARLIRQPYGYFAERIKIKKNGVRILDCGESGSTLRFLLPVACALGLRSAFRLGGRLPQRPMDELFAVLEAHGASIAGRGSAEIEVGGLLRPGLYEVPGDVSSQYISGLLFALPLLGGGSEIAVTRSIESRGYIEATLSALRSFGVDMRLEGNRIRVPESVYSSGEAAGGGRSYEAAGGFSRPAREAFVEGDWSNAAFWLVLGAAGKGAVTVSGLDEASAQGDKAICELLARFGAKITRSREGIGAAGGELRGIEIDAADIPDLVPALAVAAAAAQGDTYIYNAGRLKFKESDRLHTVAETLNGLGGEATETGDGLLIKGRGRLTGGTVEAFGDHRIAMMAAVASVLCAEPVMIRRAEAVAKSYPAFFEDLKKLGANLAVSL